MSQRKRATGFALMDTAFAADSKFLRLARISETTKDFAASVGVFWLLLAEARRAKTPDVDWDDYTEYSEQIRSLQEAKLLVGSGFEPATFERWAPAYQSPADRARGTRGDAEVRKGTQGYEVSNQITSSPIVSVPVPENALLSREELPGETDSATLACRWLLDGGRWLGDREYVAAWDDMDRRYGSAWVQAEIQPAYTACMAKRDKVWAWDLKRMVELRCAERSRAEDRERAEAHHRREQELSEQHRRAIEAATPEQREQAKLQQQAIRIGLKLGIQVPTDPEEVQKFVMKHGSAA